MGYSSKHALISSCFIVNLH